MRRSIVVCADDFAMTHGIDTAILELADAGRLSAVACMATGPRWHAAAREIRRFDGRIDVGIHLTLTDLVPLTGTSSVAPDGRLRSYPRLLRALALGQVRGPDIRNEIDAQLDRFAESFGRLPDFVDGHHHAHQFPGVAAPVVSAIEDRASRWRPWLRSCVESPGRVWRRGVAPWQAAGASLLGLGLRRRAAAAGIPTNIGISGFYDVRSAHRFESIFPALLAHPGPRHLMFLHPGRCESDIERQEPWMRCREHEREFLSGPGYARTLEARGLSIGRFGA